MENVYTILEKCHQDKMKEKELERININNIARIEYNVFCAWCNAFKDAQYTEQNFREYVNSVRKLNFWIKKKIGEIFFNYKYTFNYNTKEWSCVKEKTV